MLIDATMQSKNPKKSTRRGHKRSTSRGTRKDQTEHQERCRKNTFGRQPVHGKVGQFRLSLSPCALCKKNTIRDHKRSTRETRGFAKTEHQQVQSESTNEAPESTIRDRKRSTRETREVFRDQNGAPASPIREHKWSTRKHNQRPQKEHQKISKKTVFSRDFHLQLILIGQLTQLSQNYFALQSLHKALPSTTLCKLCSTK